MTKKILYLFSDTGGGHRSAATAIIRAVEHVYKNEIEQERIDVFAACSGFLNIFAKLYAPVIKYTPKLWGQLYYWLDDQKKLEMLEKVSGPFILNELVKLIQEKKPDVIVSVHPMVNHLTVEAIRQSGLKIPFIIVITDPVTLHRAWITPAVDMAIVATDAAKQLAVQYGMPEEKIKIFGMPIDPKFFLETSGKQKARKKGRLNPELFTILLMGGGEGAGKMDEIIENLNKLELKIQVIVIAGRNKSLEAKLKKDMPKFKFPMKVFGFTDKVHEIMAESDIIITKAGPGTIAEAMAMNLPIIITSWLPGQEEGNVEYVVRENVGKVSQDPVKVVEIINELLSDKKAFEEMKANIRRASRPQAALDIAGQILSYL
ncbi:MAG: glycosyltransferase [Candidatus Margulisbacteria bacterium]|nr:glycosyltransferase [Candidatus Margulisiibacteriota bacterium]